MAVIFVQTGARYIQGTLYRFLSRVLPPGTEQVVLDQFRGQGKKPGALLVVAFMLSLWAASSVVKSLIDGFNAAYRVPRNRSMGGHIGMGLLLVIFAGIPLLGASSLILFGGAVERGILNLMRVDPLLNPLEGWLRLVAQVMRYVVAFSATSSLMAMLYYYGPNRPQRWKAVWPGAFLATVLWLLATLGFGWYVRNISNYNLLYGGVGTSIALLSWMYILALIALFGCEFNAETERMQFALEALEANEATARV